MTLATDLNSIQSILTRYILLIFLTFGIIGNLLNIIVFAQKHLRTNSCSIYFISTSIFNFLAICFGMIPVIYASYSSYDLGSYSIAYCKFRSYILHVLLMMARFSVALAAVDRFALCSPNVHIRSFSQRHIAIKSVVVSSCLWLVIPVHVLVEINIYMPGRRCGANGIYLSVYSIYAAVVTAIPLLIMVVFSILAIRNLRHIRSRVHPNSSTGNSEVQTGNRIRKRDTQFLILLAAEVIVYISSTVLFPLYSIYSTITASISKSSDRLAVEGFIRFLALSFLIYFNSCSIFYVHLLASKAFRQECKQLFFNVRRPNQASALGLPCTVASTGRKQFNHMTEHFPMDTLYRKND